MPITITAGRETLSADQIQKLAQEMSGGTAKEISQVLTRFDFQNKRFADHKALQDAVHAELLPDVQKWFRSLTPDANIQRAVDGNFLTDVVLVRGTSAVSAQAALSRKSAGGEISNFGTPRPTEQEAISQVGGSQPGAAQVKLPEFTPSMDIADKWAKRGGFFFIKINAKYLTRGDIGQKGWIAKKAAPISGGYFYPHPNPVAFNIPNAD
ncbi:MAG: DUF4765 family protein [Litoreibacter sp.]|uniref:DUF4765 family protein n=1 Tax=Litoreibacter sp. TaxID=1969459 RepID=UPI003296A381